MNVVVNISLSLIVAIITQDIPKLKYHTVLLTMYNCHFWFYLSTAGNNKKSEDGRNNGDATLLALMTQGLQTKERSWLLEARKIKEIVLQVSLECSLVESWSSEPEEEKNGVFIYYLCCDLLQQWKDPDTFCLMEQNKLCLLVTGYRCEKEPEVMMQVCGEKLEGWNVFHFDDIVTVHPARSLPFRIWQALIWKSVAWININPEFQAGFKLRAQDQ